MSNHYPPFVEKMEQTDPKFYKIVTESLDLIMAPDALDMKTKLLMALAIDIYAGSAGVKPLSDLARQAGASNAEINETRRVAYYIAGNRVMDAADAAF